MRQRWCQSGACVAIGLRAGRRSTSLAMRVLIRQPRIRGLLVVRAATAPLLLDAQVALEPQQRVGRRHQAAGEEMASHPVVVAFGLERIHQFAMTEDMHEQFAAGAQPARRCAAAGVS